MQIEITHINIRNCKIQVSSLKEVEDLKAELAAKLQVKESDINCTFSEIPDLLITHNS